MSSKKFIEFDKPVFDDGTLAVERSFRPLLFFFAAVGFCGVDDGSTRFRLSGLFETEFLAAGWTAVKEISQKYDGNKLGTYYSKYPD